MRPVNALDSTTEKPKARPDRRPRIVIVGAGFGGLAAAKALKRADAEITIIDRQNHHLFQPLLYQVATAGLSPAEIAWPVRHILKRQKNARVVMGEVSGIDTAATRVQLADGTAFGYDFLILATGTRHSYFGHDDWESDAPGLKDIDDATRMRRHILLAFERAETAADPAERERQLTFAIVGAGPTGVELAGSLAELARRALAADFRTINPRSTRILLVEGAERVLPAMPQKLSDFAGRALLRMGVEVRTGTLVTNLDAHGVTLKHHDGTAEELAAATVLWAAGNEASPAGRWLGAETDSAGRVMVEGDLTVPQRANVFAIGDTARVPDASGEPLPGIAPVARQQGKYVARVIAARLRGTPHAEPFRYMDTGQWATIGRNSGVISWGRLRMKGALAWWLWGIVHIMFLMMMRERLIVAIRWLWGYVTFGSGARLITGPTEDVA